MLNPAATSFLTAYQVTVLLKTVIRRITYTLVNPPLERSRIYSISRFDVNHSQSIWIWTHNRRTYGPTTVVWAHSYSGSHLGMGSYTLVVAVLLSTPSVPSKLGRKSESSSSTSAAAAADAYSASASCRSSSRCCSAWSWL